MHDLAPDAMRITAELNSGFHESEECSDNHLKPIYIGKKCGSGRM